MKNYTYIFLAKIYPHRVNFNLTGLPKFEFKHSDWEITGNCEVEIFNSDVVIKFISPFEYTDKTDCNIETLKNTISDVISGFVDAFCYTSSFSYDVDIEKVICPQLNLLKWFSIQAERNIKPYDNLFKKLTLLLLSGKHPLLPWVLSDFRRACKYPSMSASFCYRAIEIVRQSYFGIYNSNQNSTNYQKERVKKSWSLLNEILLFEESDHDELIEWATTNRHGNFPAITYKKRLKIMNHTRDIINKFINFIEQNDMSEKIGQLK
jgi:hypothetical protein